MKHYASSSPLTKGGGFVRQFEARRLRVELTPWPPLLEREGEIENEMISFQPPSLFKRRGFGG